MIICKICGKEFDTEKAMSWHVKHHNLTNKDYYDKYIKSPNEGICLTCGKPTKFVSMKSGYRHHCNKNCMNQDKTVQTKRLNTNIEKYGYATSFFSKETQDKVKQTIQLKYGVSNPYAADAVKQKIKKTNLKKYGVENPQQNHEIHVKTMKHYKYNSLNFDSSWELAVYIYCIDHNIHIEREPVRFKYTNFDGKDSYYFPDFIIDDELVEIKGDQFLNEDNTLKDKAKLKCMNEHNVSLWIKSDVQKYITYCEEKFEDIKWYNQFR